MAACTPSTVRRLLVWARRSRTGVSAGGGDHEREVRELHAKIILVNRANTDAKTLEIQRGYGSTQAEEHANGSLV